MDEFRIVASRAGGPDVLLREHVEISPPGPGEAYIRQTVVGVNYIDTYFRSGLYGSNMPTPLGSEAAGRVEAIGEGVVGLAPGDRVAYGTGGLGAYATVRTIAAEHLISLPDWISDDVAASVMLKGMTAAYLVGPCGKVEGGQTALVHSAAGGVGTLLVQWLDALGVRVIAHVGSAAKAAFVPRIDHADILTCQMEQLSEEVKKRTGNRGAEIVFDGVGAQSWLASLAAVAPMGLLVSYGNASGPVPAFSALDLMKAGSIFVTRPTLADYGSTAAQRIGLVQSLFERIRSGDIEVSIGQRFSLKDAAEAHRALEARLTRGATVLMVD